MSDIESETISLPCANPKCTCQVPSGTGHKVGAQVFCNEQCANPDIKGCGNPDCPSNH